MKRIVTMFISLILLFLLIFLVFPEKQDSNKLRVAEVTHSIFYAPQYAAISEGYFKDEGIDIELILTPGADKVTAAVLSGDVEIGFCGPEATIYVYQSGETDYLKTFAQLTKKDGSFLVGREEEKDFSWSSLRGKEIIGGRPGGIPEMALEYVLKENGLNPNQDVNMVTNIDFTATSDACKSGTAAYVALFEPTATMLEKDGSGYIVSSIGESAGNIAYTCFYSTKSYMENNPEIIQSFTNAIYKGQIWIKEHTSEEIADSIISFFPGTDKEIIISVLDNYTEIDAYCDTPMVKEEELNRLMDIIEGYDESLIKERPPFEVIVDNTFAEKASK